MAVNRLCLSAKVKVMGQRSRSHYEQRVREAFYECSLYGVTYSGLFVKFFVLMWSVQPPVSGGESRDSSWRVTGPGEHHQGCGGRRRRHGDGKTNAGRRKRRTARSQGRYLPVHGVTRGGGAEGGSCPKGATTAEKLRGTEVWVPTPGSAWGSSSPAVGVQGYHPRKIFEKSHAKYCILVTTVLIRTCISEHTTVMSRAQSVPKF